MPAKAIKPAKFPAKKNVKRGEQDLNLAQYDRLPIGVFRTTPEGEPLYANWALARMFGYKTPQELRQKIKNVADDLYSNPKDRIAVLRKLKTKAEIHVQNIAIKHRNGKIIYVEITAHAVKDSQGNILYIEGTGQDTTKRLEAERKLMQLKEQLAKRVSQRTAELEKSNKELSREIKDRKRAEKELKQLIKQEKKHKDELEKLAKVSRALRQAKQSTDFVQMLNCEVRELCGADLVAGILFKSLQTPVITCDKNANQTITDEQQAVIRDNLLNAGTDHPPSAVPGFQAIVLLRLKSSDGLHGAVLVASRELNAFDSDERNILKAVSDMAGVALQRISILEALENQSEARRQGLVVLYNLMTMVAENMKLQDILELALVLTLEAIQIDKGILYQIDESDGKPALKVAAQRWSDAGRKAAVPLFNDALAQKVLESQKEIVADDLCDQPAYTDVHACCYAGIPIRSRGVVRGVLSLFADEKGRFSPDAMTLLSSISDHIGIGIENAALFDKMRTQVQGKEA